MSNALVTVFLLGVVFGTVELSDTNKYAQTRIIGGTGVAIYQRPFIVSVHRRREGFVCGAVIISSKWIMTALHCMYPSPRLKTQYYIRAGTKYYDHGGTFHVFRHVKMYNTSVLHDFGTAIPIHDITLIKVFPQFQFSVKILPARLPEYNEEPPDELWVSGWGITSLGRLSRALQTVDVHRIPTTLCKNMSKIYETLMADDLHICYGGMQKDSCNGDSGGPLGFERTIYGLVSFGEDCGKFPGVYVKLSYYSDWIN
ncbi:hypothetical protein PV327_011543, partial [Microctonus hyperodae]